MMQSQRHLLVESLPCSCIVIIVTVVVAQVLVGVSSVAVPSSNCYALDNSSRIVDFSSWIGHFFEYEGKDTDLVIRFCKDVETRSQTGYVDFGQFNNFNHFVAGSGGVDFVQGYYNGDLLNCEQSYDKLGRTAQVNIICGSCSNGQCKGELGCICNVTQESSCRGSQMRNLLKGGLFLPIELDWLAGPFEERGEIFQVSLLNILKKVHGASVLHHVKRDMEAISLCTKSYLEDCLLINDYYFEEKLGGKGMIGVSVELAIPCEKPGPRAFEGFTVGFHPRSWEIVYNGMTQLGYEKSHHEFSFATEQTQVTLYMTAIASLSTLVRKPMIQILPEKGLEVTLSGSGATGSPPTTLTPTLLNVEWTCQEARDTPYEVNVTIPIEGYEPIQFFLTKICEHRQGQRGDSTRGWAIFGIISCIFIVTSTLFCVGGFIYKTRMERLHGIDALPGMTYLTACLETASGVGNGYSRPEENASGYASEASWERPSATAQGTRKQSTQNYGSI